MISLEDRIAKLCLDKYASFKKTGKPLENEWTVLSGIVLENSCEELYLISLCTGTKCLSGVELRNTTFLNCGVRLSDSHAEVLTRRAFLRYLYNQIELVVNNKESDIFFLNENNVQIKDVYFHFYSSQTPCGDCSIIPKFENFEAIISQPKKAKQDFDDIDESGFGLTVSDVYRTGAKCIDNEERQDSHEAGVLYHTVGPLRTKPGRGDRTLSLSCSDKIAKWNVLGVQGALLSLIIPTIRFKTITIGGGCPYSLDSMQRGLWKRFNLNIEIPKIQQSKLIFNQSKGGLRIRPCPSSIIWCAVQEKAIEISVNGLRQGTTKKKNKSSSLLISRKEIFKTFLILYDKILKKKIVPQHPKKIMYIHYKQYSTSYQNLKKDNLKMFSNWPIKPSHLQDCLPF